MKSSKQIIEILPLLWAIFLASSSTAGEIPQMNSEKSDGVAFRPASACGACHSRIYNEWSESWMARSYSNATFQAIYAYRTESDKQNATTTARDCLRCHAPLGFCTKTSPASVQRLKRASAVTFVTVSLKSTKAKPIST